ncbi:RNA-binding S4 domain-containing protein [Oceaniglobus indicus]|uniref:RNA-binding S4 domain-containing protein n=1 Tax=Oceaniglobus indicus TaxID=2047749 RepID=UPI000C19CAB2|nr:RNA-binding S4 domain-containing protein [Oceaniglobus indicus]
MTGDERSSIRVDKWLWFARFFKTRGIAAKLVTSGHLRINGERAGKPARVVGPGDVLTFPQGQVVRVVEVCDCGTRRGPAPEAQLLYHDRTPTEIVTPDVVRRESGGRPTGKARRDMAAQVARMREGPLE